MPTPSALAAAGGKRTSPEVADVVRGYGVEYRQSHRLSAEQRKVLRAIANCRTAALGGHVEQCESCGEKRISYNSCRNRHCPKCQGKERARWMAAEQAMLLPVGYFHVIFTLPHVLNPLVRVNRRLLYTVLFRPVARTLRIFALDPKHLKAEPAITMVLHTWGQTLGEHYHVHCVICGGGLSLDGRHWVRLCGGKKRRRRPFLFPVQALSKVFRGKVSAAIKHARKRKQLCYHGQSTALANPAAWQALIDKLWEEDWAAISNRRILSVQNGRVRFSYRDYADSNRQKEITLAAGEFLRRFLLHVLPRGFMRIRHYGITANCRRKKKLARARQLLGQSPPATAPDKPLAASNETHDGNLPDSTVRCPACGAPMRSTGTIAPVPSPYDSS